MESNVIQNLLQSNVHVCSCNILLVLVIPNHKDASISWYVDVHLALSVRAQHRCFMAQQPILDVLRGVNDDQDQLRYTSLSQCWPEMKFLIYYQQHKSSVTTEYVNLRTSRFLEGWSIVNNYFCFIGIFMMRAKKLLTPYCVLNKCLRNEDR